MNCKNTVVRKRMPHETFTIFLSIALLGNAGAAVSGLYTYTVNPDNVSVTITDYPETATGAIEIPATIDGRSVTSIGDAHSTTAVA